MHLKKQHLNIVNLLGACTKNELLVIVEYCQYGSIHDYLFERRNHFIDQIDADTGEIDVTRQAFSQRTNPVCSNAEVSIQNTSSSDLSLEFIHAYDDTDYSDSSFSHSGSEPNSPLSANVMLSANLTRSENDDRPSANTKGNYIPNNIELTTNVIRSETGHQLSANILGDDVPNEVELTTTTLVSWAYQIANGMEYLSSKKVIHGDLAARNILLSNNNVVKISDFGLAKKLYSNPQYCKENRLEVPFKWLAIESLAQGIYTTQSDIWSYGIVLWELFSLAGMPYSQISNFYTLRDELRKGYRMSKPQYANEYFYRIMRNCWEFDSDNRPTFSELLRELRTLMENHFREEYIHLIELYNAIAIPNVVGDVEENV